MAHAGFDRLTYPGDNFMRWLWDKTNLAWTGFYLAPAPSQPYTGWMQKRAFLAGLGWGFAPIYVGQQARGPGSKILTERQGRLDAARAAMLARNAGFRGHSCIYLDIEQGPPLEQKVKDYYGAWVQGIFDNGFYPGVYCSFLIANQLDRVDARPVTWVFHLTHRAGAYRDPFPDPDPGRSNYFGAAVWQLAQNCSLRVEDDSGTLHRLAPVDFDSATMADPSNFLDFVNIL
jgi:hypothetical protein